MVLDLSLYKHKRLWTREMWAHQALNKPIDKTLEEILEDWLKLTDKYDILLNSYITKMEEAERLRIENEFMVRLINERPSTEV